MRAGTIAHKKKANYLDYVLKKDCFITILSIFLVSLTTDI
jgi:hypothetical protein